jgi:hypothetical protein
MVLRTLFVLGLLTAIGSPPAMAGLTWKETAIEIPVDPLAVKAEAVFVFTNDSNATLTITEARSSCGCTVPELAKRIYAPGESGEIRAVYTFGAHEGRQSKHIVVATDEPGASPYELTLSVDIPRLFEVKPSFVVWRVGDAPEPKSITVRALVPDAAHPVSVESQDTRLEAKLEAVAGEPGVFRIWLAPEATEANFLGKVVVRSNAPANEPRVITVYGLVR